jgi:hypothetical protein
MPRLLGPGVAVVGTDVAAPDDVDPRLGQNGGQSRGLGVVEDDYVASADQREQRCGVVRRDLGVVG